VSAAPDGPWVVPLYYDFASSLCYVTHRVMEELAGEVAGLGVVFDWCPLDLAALRGLVRGAPIRPADRERIVVLSRDLGVPLRIPERWLDSRAAAAAAAAVTTARAATWRERVWTAIYEEGRPPEAEADVLRLARGLEVDLDAGALATGARAVERHTETARAREVTGVPTFQLGRWPFGGIQDRDTMLRVLERYACKAREGALAP
jgi:predicted DsbA family dithiol-disulfide isomerase